MKRILFSLLLFVTVGAAAQEVTRGQVTTLFYKAQKAMKAGKNADALNYYKAILSIDETLPVPYLMMADIYAQDNSAVSAELALKCYKKYLTLNPADENAATLRQKISQLKTDIAKMQAQGTWQAVDVDLAENVKSNPQQTKAILRSVIPAAMQAETKEEMVEIVDKDYSLWDKAQTAYNTGNTDAAEQYLTEITQSTTPSQPLFAQASAMLAEIYASQGDMAKMQEVLEMLEYNLKINQNFVESYHIKLKDATPFEDDVCGIWVSNLSTDKNKLPYLAFEVSNENGKFKAKILPYCTLAESYKMYSGKAFNWQPTELKSEKYFGYLPYSNSSNINPAQNQIGFVFGDEKYRRGLDEDVAKAAVAIVGAAGEKFVESLKYTDLGNVELELVGIGVAGITAGIQKLFESASVDSRTITLYDFNIERLFTGCADLELIETKTKQNSTGYERVSSDTIPMRLFKLYPEYNIMFSTKDNEVFGYRQLTTSEIIATDEYEHILLTSHQLIHNSYAAYCISWCLKYFATRDGFCCNMFM
ncbi:MAG: tetratricopeptide repeat protein [Candidatus Symbiothrix sp.]|jgi:outer membrane protein assembly factor BamD (BamD/ComL family)|nr:tetratricopeptide repeat protein [Candidatus Symbiothrix sp.]